MTGTVIFSCKGIPNFRNKTYLNNRRNSGRNKIFIQETKKSSRSDALKMTFKNNNPGRKHRCQKSGQNKKTVTDPSNICSKLHFI